MSETSDKEIVDLAWRCVRGEINVTQYKYWLALWKVSEERAHDVVMREVWRVRRLNIMMAIAIIGFIGWFIWMVVNA